MDILFRNATTLTMCDEQPIIEGGFVGVKDGFIVHVGAAEPEEKPARVVDCRGDILMPGLVNAHAHTAMCLMRGYADDYALHEWLFEHIFPVEAKLTAGEILIGARLGFAEMIASGTTSVSDMYFCQPDVAQLALETGMRVSLCNGVVALGGTLDPCDRCFTELDALVRDFHGNGDGLVRADASIHAEYTSFSAAWEKEAELALEHGLVLHLHLSETKAEHEACIAKYGKTPARAFYDAGVFRAKTLAAHCVWLADEDMDILAENGVSAAHCPVSNLKLGSGIARVHEMMQRGVNVALGTDGCCSNNSHDLFEEIKLAALLAKGASGDPTRLPAYEAVRLATVNGAKAQGREGQIGRVKVGYQADLILIDTASPSMCPMYAPASAVAYAAKGSDVRLTMIRGKILYENGAFTTIDIEKAIREARDIALRLHKENGR
ncbi:MAG TPA: amidohydrolase [Clostridia bacterium]|nr:amidohydrolase [Clostridia bacterium]